MTPFENNLNQLLVKVYRSIEQLEEEMLLNTHGMDLSISEMHMLEAVAEAGREGTVTISKIAEYLAISLPSVTAPNAPTAISTAAWCGPSPGT